MSERQLRSDCVALAPEPSVVDWVFRSSQWGAHPVTDAWSLGVRRHHARVWVGNVTSYTLADVSIDDVVLGVKAVDRDGNASLVSAYQEPPYRGAAAQ
jgi:hypothetical protein